MAVGENRTSMFCEPPGAIDPLDQFEAYPLGPVMEVTVSAAFPLFVIVTLDTAVVPTGTLPNAKFPLSPMTLVDVDEGLVGDDGEDDLLPHALTLNARAITHTKCFITALHGTRDERLFGGGLPPNRQRLRVPLVRAESTRV